MSRFTVGIILLFTTAALSFFVIVPQWGNIATTKVEISRLQALNDELVKLAEERDLLTQQYNGISESDLSKLQSIAPVGPQTGTALVDFESLATKNAMFLSRIDFTGASQSTGGLIPSELRSVTPLPVSISVRGSYAALRTFLHDIEHMLRIFDLADISFGAGAAGTNDQTEVSIKGNMYYRAQ